MARTFPRSLLDEDLKSSAERKVFEALRDQLSDEWSVFHSASVIYRDHAEGAPSSQSWSRRGRMVSAKHVGIKIYVTGPLDRAGLTVHGDGLEDLPVITNRSEHPAGLQKPGQIDLVHRAVRRTSAQSSARRAAHVAGECVAMLRWAAGRGP